MILQNFAKLATFGPKLMAPVLRELQPYLQPDPWLPNLWLRHTQRQSTPGSPHHSTETIFLCGPAEFSLSEYFSTSAIDFDPEQQALPLLTNLAISIFRLLQPDDPGRVLIVNLKPQSEIDEHFDEGAYADHFNNRVHLSLVSSGQDYLACGNESVSMLPGELWWFNHKVNHMAENWGETPRIHMIMDYRS